MYGPSWGGRILCYIYIYVCICSIVLVIVIWIIIIIMAELITLNPPTSPRTFFPLLYVNSTKRAFPIYIFCAAMFFFFQYLKGIRGSFIIMLKGVRWSMGVRSNSGVHVRYCHTYIHTCTRVEWSM
ncbi:hypothetical protein DFP73DRAFT_542648 [Morchella snyderi]|nr:hypothetical protein DFP73DRAFT_542648 [Morchella snyderi]